MSEKRRKKKKGLAAINVLTPEKWWVVRDSNARPIG
jgi:hypothetical protein